LRFGDVKGRKGEDVKGRNGDDEKESN